MWFQKLVFLFEQKRQVGYDDILKEWKRKQCQFALISKFTIVSNHIFNIPYQKWNWFMHIHLVSAEQQYHHKNCGTCYGVHISVQGKTPNQMWSERMWEKRSYSMWREMNKMIVFSFA